MGSYLSYRLGSLPSLQLQLLLQNCLDQAKKELAMYIDSVTINAAL